MPLSFSFWFRAYVRSVKNFLVRITFPFSLSVDGGLVTNFLVAIPIPFLSADGELVTNFLVRISFPFLLGTDGRFVTNS